MSKGHILLIFASLKKNPGIYETDVYRPPLGILTIAGPLVQQDYSVSILDERVEPNFWQRLDKELAKEPICVGISSMSGWQINNSLRISKFIKETTKIPVVWGGVHTSLFPYTIRNKYIDYIVIDDGEETFPQLVDYLLNSSSDLQSIKGIGFKNNGEVVLTESAPPADISKLPFIPFHLVDFSKYTKHKTRELPPSSGLNINHNIPIETSRGCPYSCAFCTESKRKKKWRALAPERVINDIKYYVESTGLNGFSIIDDNFFGNPRRGKEIIDLLIKENLNISWHTNARTDFMARQDDVFIQNMEKSGCKMIVFGAESGSTRILKMINKKATIDDVINTNHKLAKSNIIPSFICIQGFPTETLEDIKKTYLLNIQLLTENKKAINSNAFLIPTPATVIAEMTLGKKAETMELEEWGEIFDLRMEKKHPWVLKETYEFIRKNRYMYGVLRTANRFPIPILNKFIHLILWSFKIKLKYEIDIKVDRFILNFIFRHHELFLRILNRIFKINLVGA